MSAYFRSHSQLLLNIGGFAINLIPFLLYLMIVSRSGTLILNALPFALFYAFRRTALFSIRGNVQQDNLLGWIGLGAAILGLIIGLFGTLNAIIWDLSGALVGIGAAFFPSVQKQFNLTHQRKNDRQNNKQILLFLSVLLMVGVIVITGRRYPVIAFATVLFFALLGAIAFYYDPLRRPTAAKINLNLPNVILSLLLFLSVFLVRIGRSLGKDRPAILGIALLAVILIAIIVVFVSGNRHSHLRQGLRMRMMIFGICADFCAIFSALYLGVAYGIKVYAGIIISYLLAFVLGNKMVDWLASKLPFATFTIELSGIILGLLLTLNIYTYFIGIFMIRAFAFVQNQDAIAAYNAQENNHNSYMVSYRLMSIAGLTTQFILWLSLLISVHQTGFTKILSDFTFHHTTTRFLRPLLITQIILILWAIVFICCTFQKNRKELK